MTGRWVSCLSSSRSRPPGWSTRSWSWPRPNSPRRAARPGPGWGCAVRRRRRHRTAGRRRPDHLFHPGPGRGHAGLAGRPDRGVGVRDHPLLPGKGGPAQHEAGPPAGARADHRDVEGGRPVGQNPGQIRQDIEETRAEMSETVEAVGYKADVPSRAKDKVSETVDNVKNKVSDTATRAKEAVVGTASRAGDTVSETTSRVGDATPSGGQVKQQAKRAVGLAQENPLGLAVGAAAGGFLAGLAG